MKYLLNLLFKNIMSSYTCTTSTKPSFSVRIVVCDHYLTKPAPGIDVTYSEFRGADIKQVPVLRIFGPTPDGYKACLHVHGVFPYFYVPCPSPNPVPQFLYQIAASLDKALNIALKQATSSHQHVYKITLVKGLPFYGFHDKEHLYLKVFLYNPGLIKQAVELCSNGAILGQVLQPHESHLNFTLQFFIDFNLFGMSNVDLQNLQFRKRHISQESDILIEWLSNESILKPESVCHYEADCMASHIINRLRIGKGDGIENPGLEEVWNQEMERRKQLNISLISKSLSQGRLKMETESHYKYDEMFRLKMFNTVDDLLVDSNETKDEVHYPAVNQEGSQVFDAVDVTVHHPSNSTMGLSFNESMDIDNDKTLINDMDSTIVDESIALNSSLSIHYSQIALDSEDMGLLEILKDMEDKTIEEDSVLGTPGNNDNSDNSDDDEEYSQIYHEETLVLDPRENKNCDDNNSGSLNWNDTFWEDVAIPQLDGACDDEHTKKVRKRKKTPSKLKVTHLEGKCSSSEKDKTFLSYLSQKLNKKSIYSVEKKLQNASLVSSDITENQSQDINEQNRSSIDEMINKNNTETELNNSMETINANKSAFADNESELNLASIIFENKEEKSEDNNFSITNIVNKQVKREIEVSELYDIQRNITTIAGPSSMLSIKSENISNNTNFFNLSLNSTSSEENNLGIMSFYNMSKIFNGTLNNSDAEIESSPDSDNNSQKTDAHLINIDKIMCTNKSSNNVVVWTPKLKPPTTSEVISSLKKYNIPRVRHSLPYYSYHKDAGDKVEIGQTVLKVLSKLPRDQKPFEANLAARTIEEWRQLIFLKNNDYEGNSMDPDALKLLLANNRSCILGTVLKPPTTSKVIEWTKIKELENIRLQTNLIENKDVAKHLDELEHSQAIGLDEDVIDNTIIMECDGEVKNPIINRLHVTMQTDGSFLCFGNGSSQSEEIEAPTVEKNFLTVMILELLNNVRADFHPDPLKDSMIGAFLTVSNDCPTDHFLPQIETEIIIVDQSTDLKLFDRCGLSVPIKYVNTESELIQSVVNFVRKHNPDIMCGYEVEMSSWGYFIERSQVLGVEIILELSRIPEKCRQKRSRPNDNDFEGKILGRITFNVWRLFRYELALSSYSFENCMSIILNERVPQYTYSQLNKWWNDPSRTLRWVPIEHYMTKISGTLRMLEKLDIINRTSELARLFGLQWWEVLSRGSQFRVESLMLRAARPLNLVALSPTVKQRAAMKAPECLPLIFEPESRYYADPVIVLDFQSLYPSMMIAYNYCFSTCIGRAQNINGDASYEFGAWRLRIPKAKLETLVNKDLVHWSPVGAGFVKTEVRRGVLPALLRRILAARQAVKKNMKKQTDEAVKKAMHSRQLGLKLIANVTYGYTAANFSGRMPCVEVGDSVVSKGRETLERAIKLVENSNWNAKVVYGDTDSMFVVVPGGTRDEAFRIGQEIADAVTADNPSPVVLKLEKVYQPCILQTKKRYVGYMYESANEENPVYEAKGIETVRRDGCPAGVKLLQRSLCELFSSCDVSKIKIMVQKELRDLVRGVTPLPELMFTREYHGPQGYRPGASAPPNEIAKRLMSRDPRAAPRAGWRVAWLVAAGSAPLARLARSAQEARRERCRLHVTYYATRVLLPPLNRCLSLLGVNVFKWWTELGYIRTAPTYNKVENVGIARYMSRGGCAVCGARGGGLCGPCAGNGRRVAGSTMCRLRDTTGNVWACEQICASCCGHVQSQDCINVECPVLWRRQTAEGELRVIREVLSQLPAHLRCDHI